MQKFDRCISEQSQFGCLDNRAYGEKNHPYSHLSGIKSEFGKYDVGNGAEKNDREALE